MLKIGDFSILSKISIHMLRNYDKLGLLPPAHVDAKTGYRYYSESQLPIANRIQALKSMGLGLSTIKDILNEYKDSGSLAGYLGVQAAHKRKELDLLQQQIRQLETTIVALRKNDNILRYSIEVKQIPSRIVASIRDTIASYDKEAPLWIAIEDTLTLQQIPLADLSYDMAIYHNNDSIERGIDIELQKAVVKKGKNTEKVIFKEAPAILAAVLTYEGEYGQIYDIVRLIADWTNDNQYRSSGPHFNIYHRSPKTESNIQKMITEVGFPIQKVTKRKETKKY